jgi:hypothetical protein
MLLLLKAFLGRLNPHAVRIGLFVLATLFAVLALVQAADYFAARLRHFHLGRQQTQAEARHSQATRSSTARSSAYQLDSLQRAAARRQRLVADSLLANQDAYLSTTRPARVVLPARPLPGN